MIVDAWKEQYGTYEIHEAINDTFNVYHDDVCLCGQPTLIFGTCVCV